MTTLRNDNPNEMLFLLQTYTLNSRSQCKISIKKSINKDIYYQADPDTKTSKEWLLIQFLAITSCREYEAEELKVRGATQNLFHRFRRLSDL